MKSRAVIRILDDDEEFLDAMVFLLTTEGWEVQAFTNAKAFLASLDARPGCIVLDARMPELSGPAVQEQLLKLNCELPVIFLTGHGTLDMAVHVFRNGAYDFLQKPVQTGALLATVQRAVEADRLHRLDAQAHSPMQRYQQLTEREKDIIADVAQSLSNRAIAEHFGISERTVEAHRSSAMHKLGLRKPHEVAQFLQILEAFRSHQTNE